MTIYQIINKLPKFLKFVILCQLNLLTSPIVSISIKKVFLLKKETNEDLKSNGRWMLLWRSTVNL